MTKTERIQNRYGLALNSKSGTTEVANGMNTDKIPDSIIFAIEGVVRDCENLAKKFRELFAEKDAMLKKRAQAFRKAIVEAHKKGTISLKEQDACTKDAINKINNALVISASRNNGKLFNDYVNG